MGQRIFYIICLYLWTVLPVRATFFCRVHHFATDNGLLQAHISNAQQDETGFIWFATWNGLMRFDGHGFYTFKPILNSNGTIFSNRIYNIKRNHAGSIWCVSSDNRLFLFDKESCLFTDVQNGIPITRNKKVKVLTPLKNGVTWVTFKDFSCLRLYDANPQKGYQYYPPGSDYLGGSRKILDIKIDGNGDEWILTDKSAVCPSRNIKTTHPYQYIEQVGKDVYLIGADGTLATVDRYGKIHALPTASATVNAIAAAGPYLVLATAEGVVAYHTATGRYSTLSHNAAFYLYTDSRQRVWSFGGTDCVDLLMPAEGKAKILNATPSVQNKPMRNPQLIFEDASHTVILKPEKGVLSYYDELEGRLKDCLFYHDGTVKTYAPADISKFLIDFQGNLWTFQAHEADCISFYPNYFSHWTNLRKTETRAIFRDSSGQLWAADRSLGVFRFNGQSDTKTYLCPDGQMRNGFTPFTRMPAYCMAEDAAARIWIGTKGDGVYLLTPGNPVHKGYCIEHFLHDAADSLSLRSDSIYAILYDSLGNTWLGSYGQGLLRAEHTGEKWKFHAMEGFPPGVKIRCITEAQKGVLLIGTTGGLITADLRRRSAPRYYINMFRNEEWGMKGNDVMQIVKCRGRFYVCVFGSGISEIMSANLCSNSLRFTNYIIPSEATADQIKNAVSDGKYIWVASDCSLSRFNPQTGIFRVFDHTSFIGDFNFSEAVPTVDKDRIIFGTSEGLLSFGAGNVGSRYESRRIVFTGIQYQNDMAIRPLNDIKALTIAPDERSFSLHFSSLDYSGKKAMQFRYKLVGYDKGWNYTAENLHAVNYSDLTPGCYKLIVQTINSEGTWDENGREIAVDVIPRFVETFWFRLLLLLLFLLAMAGMAYAIVYLSRMRNLIQRKYSLLMTIDEFSGSIKSRKPAPADVHTDEKAFLQQAVEFFSQNIDNSGLVVEDFARHAGLSRTAYYKRMKSITGLSPIDFIKQMRIREALKLLDDGKLPVADIAYKVGFSDPKYFSKCFKAEMDMTPTQYLSSRKQTDE